MAKDRIIGPKDVIFLLHYKDSLYCENDIDIGLFVDSIANLADKIEKGSVDDFYYRKSEGRDGLLEQEGWIHLHVAPEIDDDVLLIVEQVENSVVVIGLTRHKIFKERPKGQKIKKAMGGKLYSTKKFLLTNKTRSPKLD